MLGLARCDFHKKHAKIRYVELVFLHPVGSVGHVVDSYASNPRNVDGIYFVLGWARCGFHRKRVGTCYAKHVFL
jgi:hypothetical protein